MRIGKNGIPFNEIADVYNISRQRSQDLIERHERLYKKCTYSISTIMQTHKEGKL